MANKRSASCRCGVFWRNQPSECPILYASCGVCIIYGYFLLLSFGMFRLGKWYGLEFSKKQIRLARIITSVVAIIVALQTTGQLSHREIFVLLPLALIAYAYMSYVHPNREAVTVTD